MGAEVNEKWWLACGSCTAKLTTTSVLQVGLYRESLCLSVLPQEKDCSGLGSPDDIVAWCDDRVTVDFYPEPKKEGGCIKVGKLYCASCNSPVGTVHRSGTIVAMFKRIHVCFVEDKAEGWITKKISSLNRTAELESMGITMHIPLRSPKQTSTASKRVPDDRREVGVVLWCNERMGKIKPALSGRDLVFFPNNVLAHRVLERRDRVVFSRRHGKMKSCDVACNIALEVDEPRAKSTKEHILKKMLYQDSDEVCITLVSTYIGAVLEPGKPLSASNLKTHLKVIEHALRPGGSPAAAAARRTLLTRLSDGSCTLFRMQCMEYFDEKLLEFTAEDYEAVAEMMVIFLSVIKKIYDLNPQSPRTMKPSIKRLASSIMQFAQTKDYANTNDVGVDVSKLLEHLKQAGRPIRGHSRHEAIVVVGKSILRQGRELVKESSSSSSSNEAVASSVYGPSQARHNLEDFREEPLVPSIAELSSQSLKLRKNKTTYDSFSDYLDLHYRLVREDLFGPLREALTSTKDRCVTKYQSVRVESILQKGGSIVHRLRIPGATRKSARYWAHVRKFVFGSLVCLFEGDLEQESHSKVLFAVVQGRNENDLANTGRLVVKFVAVVGEGGDLIQELHPSSTRAKQYSIVECPVYYEAYVHTLRALQLKNEQNTSLTEALVTGSTQAKVQRQGSNVPAYMHQLQQQGVPLLFDVFYDSSREARFNVADIDALPEESCKLDSSQLAAVKHILRNEISLVQGPPGTGKSYVGDKFIHFLLSNKSAVIDGFNRLQDGKNRGLNILLVGFSNRAVDQVLLDLISKQSKASIVRIGSRTKHPKIEEITLNKLRGSQRMFQLTATLRETTDVAKNFKAVYSILASKDTCFLPRSPAGRGDSYLWNQFVDVLPSHLVRGAALNSTVALMQWTENGSGDDLGVETDSISDNSDSVTSQSSEEETTDDSEEVLVKDSNEFGIEISDNEIDEFLRELDGSVKRSSTTNKLPSKSTSKPPTSGIEDAQYQDEKATEAELVERIRAWEASMLRLVSSVPPEDYIDEHQARQWEQNAAELTTQQRRLLLLHWREEYFEKLDNVFVPLSRRYSACEARLNYCRATVDSKLIAEADIIAATVNGVSRNLELFTQLKPEIIVVEEAAEVLEAQVVAILSEAAQHLVLIGDHEQLKPHVNSHKLSVKYDLSMSLFERLVKCDMAHTALSIQRRMRPSIADNIRPLYRNALEDHESVKTYPRVRGMARDVYFFSHGHLEGASDASSSKFNEFEASFSLRLANYLIQQAYSPTDIAILTPYAGQAIKLKNLLPAEAAKSVIFTGLDKIKISTVDDVQGYEFKLVILSLVRSRDPKEKHKGSGYNIGFVGLQNRINVALSRAKHGLYVIGNISHFATHSEFWRELVNFQTKIGNVGQTMPVVCSHHSCGIKEETLTGIACPLDFELVHDGGCTQPCNARRNDCGHACGYMCHSCLHDSIPCRQPCARGALRSCRHPCPKKCYQCKDEEDGCGPCLHLIRKALPCGHIKEGPCHKLFSRDVNEIICSAKCEKVLECGHLCSKKCGEVCITTQECVQVEKVVLECGHTKSKKCSVETATLKCSVKVDKELGCGHRLAVACSDEVPSNDKCVARCSARLSCLHECKGSCGSCGVYTHGHFELHELCTEPCDRLLVCGHRCTEPCTKLCPPCSRPCERRCMHSRCQKRCDEPCTKCTEVCGWSCDHLTCPKLCHEMCDREPCNRSCDKLLPCGCPCIGMCGEMCPGLCRVHNSSTKVIDEYVTETMLGECDPEDRFLQLDCFCKVVISVRAMDRYVAAVASSPEVKYPTCMFCRHQLWNFPLRYSREMKRVLRQIDTIKEQIVEKHEMVAETAVNLRNEILESTQHEEDKGDICHKYISFIANRVLIPERIKRMSPGIIKVIQVVTWNLRVLSQIEVIDNDVGKQLTEARSVLLRRIRKMFRTFDLSPIECIELRDKVRLVQLLAQVAKLLRDSNALEGNEALLPLTDIKKRLLNPVESVIDLSEMEKIVKKCAETHVEEVERKARVAELDMVVRTLTATGVDFGVTSGRWISCECGFMYCIGECGGAMEESKCPQCGITIGGTAHTLTARSTRMSEQQVRSFMEGKQGT